MAPDRRRRLRELVEAAAELNAGSRSDYLDRACEGDAELRQEVEALLPREVTPGDPLSDPPTNATVGGAVGLPPRPIVGSYLGKYRILDKLGEGGMGEVYEAEDTELRRTVALKVLARSIGIEAEQLRRFEREAQAVAALSHPNIVTIHSVESIEGLRFFTMERVEGEALAALIPPGGLSLDRLLAIAVPLATGLACAHERGVIHRDLKPANVMVAGRDRVKILDFGLAKLRGPSEVSDASQLSTAEMTRPGSLLGTFPYMSPEQAQGQEVDHRSDIFSLGVILYEMATGKRPFEGESAAALLSSILRDSPEPVTEARPDLPRHFGRIVGHCLEKEPDRRYQSALDVRNELEALVREPTSPVTSQATKATPAAAVRRGRMSRTAVAVAVALALAVGGFAVWRAARPVEDRGATGAADGAQAEPKRIVVLPFENLGPEEDAYFASGLTEEINSKLASASGLAVISRKSAMHYAGPNHTVQEIGAGLGVDFILEGSVRWDRGPDGRGQVRITPQLIRVADDTHFWTNTFDRVLDDIFAVQADLAREVLANLDVVLLEPERQAIASQPTQNLEAYQAYLRGRDYGRQPDFYALENMSRGLEMYERAAALDPEFALAHAAAGQMHSVFYMVGIDRTQERLARARSEVNRALALEPDLPQAHLAAASWSFARQDHEAALEALAQARKGLPNDSLIFESLGRIQRRLGLWDESLENMRKALELSPRDPVIATSLAFTHMLLRRYEEAEGLYDRALAIAPNQESAYVVKAVNYWLGAADLERSRATLEAMPAGRNPTALFVWWQQEILERDFRAALQRLAAAPQEVIEDPYRLLPTEMLIGTTHAFSGQTEHARQAYETATSLLESLVVERPELARAHSALGLAYAGLGRREAAVREGRLGVELEPTSSNAESGPSRIEDLARIYVQVGEPQAALDQIEILLSIPAVFSTSLLRLDPSWDPLRQEPRFQRLLEDR